MNEQQAIALVQKTFKSAFDRSGYLHFLKNLLNEYDDEGARSNQGARIPDKFQNYVEKLERVGKYKTDDSEIMLFIVTLKNETSIERARTMQRNFIAHYLQMDLKDAALVAFVSKDPANWRFSFIKMEYRYDEEKNKIKEEFTPAKRWSFLVGANEASHTAQRKLVPIMKDDEHNPTLADLEDAFNIEKVTKEFFEKYRGLFIRTKEELDEAVSANPKTRSDFASKGIDTVNLAKKLLGQIIFLYYLQKKGWFGVARDAAWGEGSRNFLRELFDKKHGDYKNFFNDILEPLFYDALRRDRSEDDHYYPKFNCKIPFLNGGLFDPMNNYDWVKTDILLPNELFHNKTKTKEGDEGDGILDIFDRYNFTVKEDEPFEKEVAIDPELLGKAYEKFNAIRPDNYDEFLQALKSGKKGDESKFNKQYGVYYTPREIVHYMCQQSLINYLYSELNPNVVYQNLGDEKLDMFGNTVKSGQLDLTTEHRPMSEVPKEDIAMLILKGEQIKEHDERVVSEGRETTTYSFQMPESIRTHAALIDEKLANIKVCDPAVGSGAFPVGMMSEIVRARDVLTLYPPAYGIPPFSQSKSRQNGESSAKMGGKRGVYDFKRGCIENSLYGVDIDSGAVEIAKLRLWLSLVVDEDDIQNIKPLPNLDYKVMQGNSLVGLPEGILLDLDIKAKLEEQKKRYFYLTNSTEKNKARDEINALFSRLVESAKQFDPTLSNINFDFHTHFSEVFHEESGFDVVIGNPPYVKLHNIDKRFLPYYFKTFKTAEKKCDLYAFFVEKSISSLLRKKGTLNFIISDTWLNLDSFTNLRRIIAQDNTLLKIISLDNPFENVSVTPVIFMVSKIRTNEYWFETARFNISEANTNSNRSLSSKNLTPPAYIFDLTLTDESENVLRKIKEKSVALSNVADLQYGIMTADNEKFVKEKLESKYCKPLLSGEDIHRYVINWNKNRYVDYRPNEMKKKKTARPGEPERFEQPEKIVFQRYSSSRIIATLDQKQFYTLGTTIVCRANSDYSNKFLLGIVNSKLLSWWYGRSYTSPTNYIREFEQLPICVIKFSNNSEKFFYENIIKLVDRILAAKAKNPQADTNKLEEEIDKLVYQLYGLTQEEINIVEGK